MPPAKKIVHWPGKDAAVCEKHLRQLIGLGAILGFMLTWTPCEDTICENCASEVKYLTPEEAEKHWEGKKSLAATMPVEVRATS